MTVNSAQATQSYTGNGSTASFPVPFYFLVDTDLKVSRKSAATGATTVLTLNSDYTLAGAGNQLGGSLNTVSPPAANDQLFIERNVLPVQQTAYPENAKFPSASHEKALDRLTMLSQQVLSKLTFGLFRDPLGATYDLGNNRLINSGQAVDGTDVPNLQQVQTAIVGGAAPVLVGPGGSGTVGFIQAGVGANARTVQDKLRDIVHVADFGAVADYNPANDTGTDNTAAFAEAVAYLASVGGGTLHLGRGNYLGHFNIGTPYIKVIGDGRWGTTIYNAGNSAIFSITNATAPVTDVALEGVTLRNRNKAVYTSADGISISGPVSGNTCDFLTFKDIYIFQMRNSISLTGRTIWNHWERVACAESILSNLNVNGTDNQAQQTFLQCRFAVAAQHGILVNSVLTTFPLVGWTFIGCTIEHNNYNGVRVTGVGAGIQAWTFTGCYFEENTYGLATGAGTGGIQKAHVFVDCANIFGLAFDQCTFFGSAAGHADLDYDLYINTNVAAVANGTAFNCRFGVSTVNDVFWPKGVLLGMNTYSSTTNIDRSAGSFDIRDLTQGATLFTPTLTFGGNSAGITYSNRVGRYARHGNTVFFSLYFSLTSKGTSTGAAAVGGLPLTSQSTTGFIQALSINADQLASGVGNVMARILPGTSAVQVNKFAAGAATGLTDADFGGFSAISISGSYIVI